MDPRPFLLARTSRSSAEVAEIRSPDDGSVVSRVALAAQADADEAAAAASQASEAFSRTPTFERRAVLESLSRRLLESEDEIASAICDEAGKPITLARAEVKRAAETFHLAAGECERFGGEMIPIDLSPATKDFRCFVRRVPRGPVLAIGPFNFPLNLLAHKIAPALAVGAPVVVKPPPQAPTAALILGRLFDEVVPSSWPAGVMSVLPCTNEVAETLVKDDRFSVLSFTGSGPVGWKLKAASGRKHVVLELGGDAGVIVTEDADLDFAARRIAWGAMAYAGQVCISVQRIFVQASVRAVFTEKLVAAIRATPVGAAHDPKTVSGSVIDDKAADRIEQAIQSSGGKALTGGGRKGRLLEPTLIEEPAKNSAVSGEEVFGPAAGLWSYDRFDEALAAVNASQFGLQAGLFTNDMRRVFSSWDALRVGGLVVNDIPTLRVDSYPYGGTKGSGLGREGGRAGLEEYTEPRVMVVKA